MKSSDAAKKSTIKYAKTHLKRVPLDLQLTDYEKLKTTAENEGIPINRYIKESIKLKMSLGKLPDEKKRIILEILNDSLKMMDD